LGGIKRLLGGDTVSIQVEYVDNIPVVASGKYKSVINEWKKITLHFTILLLKRELLTLMLPNLKVFKNTFSSLYN
jgi:hypothetical protein